MADKSPPKPAFEQFRELADASRQEEYIKLERRLAAAKQIADARWAIAQHVHRLEDGQSKLDFADRPYLREVYQSDALEKVIYGAAQWGKSLQDDTLIRLPGGGSKRMGDMKIGDRVCAPDGGAASVVGVYPQGVIPVFKVEFADGRFIEASWDHLWEVLSDQWSPKRLSTEQISDMLDEGGGEYSVPVPNIEGLTAIDARFKSITLVGEKSATCILINHPRHLFVTANGVVTSNTEMLICDVAASAMYGMKCLVVMSTHNKRERFSKTRMDPCFEIVPEYRAAVQEAISRGQDYQSVRQKGFGGGTIALMAATVEREFTSVPGDAVWVDEHQECDQTVLPMLDDRMSGSWYRSKTFLGHPTVKGTRDNDNLDWLYQNSDQRLWNVPCLTCGRFQVLKWTTHVVHQKTNKNGAIIDLRPRDEEWKPGSRWDMRCICPFCHRPMNRFARNAKWMKNNPGHERHGFRLGNLSNPNKLLHQMFDAYVTARYSPRKMSEFVNKQLGETYSMDGTKIEEHVLEMCASGENGIPPYKFYPVDQLMWRKQELEEVEY